MVLNKAPGEKVQHTWYSRLARERRELSVSVEEALVNAPLGEGLRLDDQDQQVTVVDTGKRNNVFPPRLSLQSRFLPGSPYRVGTGLVDAQDSTVRHTSIWARLVQRLTSLFEPFLAHSATNATSIPLERESVSTQSAQVEDAIYTDGDVSHESVKRVIPAKNRDISGKSECQIITGTNVRHRAALRSTQGRQRLGGRATRVRLEVVPAPSAVYAPHKEKMTAPDMTAPDMAAFANDSSTSHHLPAIDTNVRSEEQFSRRGVPLWSPVAPIGGRPQGYAPTQDHPANMASPHATWYEKATKQLVAEQPFEDDDRGTTSVVLPAVEKVARRPVEDRACEDGDGGTTSIRLAAIGKATRRREEPSPAWHTGAGMFECGQRDVTISDPSITASSVVLVTLTANPGPVVVQYVSLQSKTGFTVHLTAPTTMGAPFNYVVLGSRPF